MSDLQPQDQPRLEQGHPSESKVAALATWALYILSIPSANLLVLVGLVVAYAVRGSSTGVSRLHVEAQIHLFWSVFWWTVLCWVVLIACIILGIASVAMTANPAGGIVGGLIVLIVFLAWFLISIWFTIKSILGLIRLLGDRAP